MSCSTPKTDAQIPPTSRAEAVSRVAEWIIAGIRPSQVTTQAARGDWTLGHAEALDLLDDAYALIEGDAEIDVDRENAKAVARFNLLYTKSLAIQDYKTALTAQQELGRLVAKLDNPFAAKKRGKTGARKKAQADQPEGPGRDAT